MSTERKSRIAQHHDYIVEALAAGTSQRNIAKTLGFSNGTLSDYMARHGLASQPRAAVKRQAEHEGIRVEVRIAGRGFVPATAAAFPGVTPAQIQTALDYFAFHNGGEYPEAS